MLLGHRLLLSISLVMYGSKDCLNLSNNVMFDGCIFGEESDDYSIDLSDST